MSATMLADVTNQVKTFWSSLFTDEVMETAVLPALMNRQYEGEIQPGGSTVKVTQFNRPTATRRTVGDRHDTFDTSVLGTTQVSVTADQVITAAFEFDSLVQLQSQVRDADSQIRKGLVEAAMIEVNKLCYSVVAPSSSSPDMVDSGVSDFNATQLLAQRLKASQQKWANNERYMLVDPSYMNDLLAAQTLTSSDYAGDDAPVLNGRMLKQRFGFWIVEDNTEGMSQLSPTANTADLALGLDPAFAALVLGAPEFEISSLHSQKRHGFIMSVKYIAGAALLPSGANRHLKVYNT